MKAKTIVDCPCVSANTVSGQIFERFLINPGDRMPSRGRVSKLSLDVYPQVQFVNSAKEFLFCLFQYSQRVVLCKINMMLKSR